MILKTISLILILIGVVFIYDARILSTNWFSFGDQNQATTGLKILGFIIAIIGAIIFYGIWFFYWINKNFVKRKNFQ